MKTQLFKGDNATSDAFAFAWGVNYPDDGNYYEDFLYGFSLVRGTLFMENCDYLAEAYEIGVYVNGNKVKVGEVHPQYDHVNGVWNYVAITEF